MTLLQSFFGFPFATRPAIGGDAFLSRVREWEPGLSELDDDQLRAETKALRKRSTDSKQIVGQDDLASAFALIGEAAYRTNEIRFYDVQLLAGRALLNNEIAEMKTGEGKTFVGALASCAQALCGQGVHMMTTNDYLAQRDYETVLPIVQRLGMTIGSICRGQSPEQKRQAYEADITYGPGYEFGFDYLRDQLAMVQQRDPRLGERLQLQHRGEQMTAVSRVQRGHFCAIVDEADSVMIDEATTPLILSGAGGAPSPYPQPYLLAQEVASSLIKAKHYLVEESIRRTSLTIQGKKESAQRLDRSTMQRLRRPWHLYVEQALRAQTFFSESVDYVLADGKIKIIDSNTGRIFEDRSWSDGLHQAVEAKEGVTVTQENNPLSGISRQQFFSLYRNLCGMTGTTNDSVSEFKKVYGLSVTTIPTHRPNQRIVQPMRVFSSEEAKLRAVVESVRSLHATGRPVLIGTRTIENSQKIAAKLSGLSFQMLNGVHDGDEAQIVAKAGRYGAIMIATNMAGRGTDIKLGDGVDAIGGLHVVISEPNESARVDRQLMGRASRQGDPGSCQMFVSSEDALIVEHAPWLVRFIAKIAGPDEEVGDDISREITKLQRAVERKKAASRREMFSKQSWMDDVMKTLANK